MHQTMHAPSTTQRGFAAITILGLLGLIVPSWGCAGGATSANQRLSFGSLTTGQTLSGSSSGSHCRARHAVARVRVLGIHGQHKWTETRAPYGFNGDETGSILDTTKQLSNGGHTLSARLVDVNNGTETLSISVTVANGHVATPRVAITHPGERRDGEGQDPWEATVSDVSGPRESSSTVRSGTPSSTRPSSTRQRGRARHADPQRGVARVQVVAYAPIARRRATAAVSR